MSEDPGIIKPKSVPLSHSARPAATQPRSHPRWLIPLALTVALLAIYAIFELVPSLITPPEVTPIVVRPETGGESPAPVRAEETLPPFQALQRDQARQQAQDELGKFVELELQLRDAMQVGEWGQESYDGAKELALAGDEAFLKDRFTDSIASYQAATAALAALIEEGERLYSEALANGVVAINARNQADADAELARALLIKPDSPELAHALERAAHLAEVIKLFREARNLELTEQWIEAVATYERIRTLDGDTPGLDAAIATARQGKSQQNLQRFLSEGFIALDNQQFEAARSAFDQALTIEPGNSIALGGLQQVAEQTVVVEIERLERLAAGFEATEEWQRAGEQYTAILALDGNIQFAKQGQARASQQQQSFDTLSNIKASAERLSSDRLYQDAQRILERASALDPRGPKLSQLILDVGNLLELYGNPVPVVLHSDNATDVVLSSVGRLGKFSEKRLTLRPGAYTLIGSRDGCRDVRTNITVRPEMAPVDIRCQEVLQR